MNLYVYVKSSSSSNILEKGAGQYALGKGLSGTFTNQTLCQPIGTEVFGEDFLLLVDTQGLVCKYAGQVLPRASILPPLVKVSKVHQYKLYCTHSANSTKCTKI